mmetsp:Transcript_49835/g.113188  ORF Transcript_49835/g.113188 Transcript_49835/m.113188 type:complete len:321 (+) Transcript_49835:7-969(+)
MPPLLTLVFFLLSYHQSSGFQRAGRLRTHRRSRSVTPSICNNRGLLLRAAGGDVELSKLNVSELKSKCRERGLKVGGLKAELVGRLVAAGNGDAVKKGSPCEIHRGAFKAFDEVLGPELRAEVWKSVYDFCDKNADTVGDVLPILSSVLMTGRLQPTTRVICLGSRLSAQCLGVVSGATVIAEHSCGTNEADFDLAVGIATSSAELSAIAACVDNKLMLAREEIGPEKLRPGLLCLWRSEEKVTQNPNPLFRAQVDLGTVAERSLHVGEEYKGLSPAVGSSSIWLHFDSIDLFNRDPSIAYDIDYEVRQFKPIEVFIFRT